MARRRGYRTARCIVHHADQILLVDHNARVRPTRWGLPGGHLEWREPPLEAARREVLEELDIRLPDLTHIGDYVYKNHLHAVYAGHTDSHRFDIDLSELSEARWFSPEQIADLAARRCLHAGYEYDAVREFLAAQSR